jgi:hypothetical protein
MSSPFQSDNAIGIGDDCSFAEMQSSQLGRLLPRDSDSGTNLLDRPR